MQGMSVADRVPMLASLVWTTKLPPTGPTHLLTHTATHLYHGTTVSQEQVQDRCPLCNWTGFSLQKHARQAHARALRRRSDEQDRVNRSRVVWNAAENVSEDALKSALGITGLLTASL